MLDLHLIPQFNSRFDKENIQTYNTHADKQTIAYNCSYTTLHENDVAPTEKQENIYI